MADSVRVSAPGSSANLGPGFDCLAVALEVRNEVEIRRTGGQLTVHSAGEGADEAPTGRENLLVRSLEAAGADPAGLEVWMRNRVPFARGLGSSAATIAAGVVAARELGGSVDNLLGVAAAVEGHPDNVAAALNGGVTLAWTGPSGVRAIGFGVPPVAFVAVIPEQRLETAAARAALPAQVPRADAVHTASRAALLVAALGTGDPSLLRDALDDRLHEPYRAPLVPLLGEVRERLGSLPAFGATLSGAGPAVLVWCEPGGELTVARALDGLRGAVARAVRVAERGAQVL